MVAINPTDAPPQSSQKSALREKSQRASSGVGSASTDHPSRKFEI